MNTESHEHLSCLMDGEISRDTGRFLVRRLGADEELCATWNRYHVMRDCLRHQDGMLAGSELSVRVRRALEGESFEASRQRSARGWLKPVAGIAIAASVALMAVIAIGPGTGSRGTAEPGVAAKTPLPSFSSPESLGPTPYSREVSLLGGSNRDSRMSAYLLRHYQATGSAGGRSFVSFVPIVVTPANSGIEESGSPSDSRSTDKDESQSQQ